MSIDQSIWVSWLIDEFLGRYLRDWNLEPRQGGPGMKKSAAYTAKFAIKVKKLHLKYIKDFWLTMQFVQIYHDHNIDITVNPNYDLSTSTNGYNSSIDYCPCRLLAHSCLRTCKRTPPSHPFHLQIHGPWRLSLPLFNFHFRCSLVYSWFMLLEANGGISMTVIRRPTGDI